MSESEDDSISGCDWPVTEEWLQAVLKEQHKELQDPTMITVVDFSVRPGCETGESVLSDILAVAVKYCLRYWKKVFLIPLFLYIFYNYINNTNFERFFFILL